ncbi:HAMP domain-containing histidine kinase [bacterium]|nr:HAMP domain-containing histidine kinase [bacterium]
MNQRQRPSEGEDGAINFLFLLMIILNILIITDLFLSILQSPTTLIFIRVALMLIVLGFLSANGLRHPEIRGRGWVSLLSGFLLVFLGSLVELMSLLPSTASYFARLSPSALNFMQNMFFDLLGYFCLAYGFFLWIPSIIEARRRVERTASELEEKVRVRTRSLQAINEQLFRNKIELEEAGRHKDEFLASVSHELKTPLNSILGFCRLLSEGRQGELNPRQAKSIQIIDNNGRNLLDQINKLLDFSRIEFETVRLDLKEVSVNALLQESLAVMEPLARHKGLALECDNSAGPVRQVTDPTVLKQLLLGILDNAVKFTDQGAVRLETGQKVDGWWIRVSDTGIGIAEKDLPFIFEAFRQGDGSLSRRYGGTGLGLTIARKLTTFLHGDITVQSTPGQGSAFTIHLPYGAPPAAVSEELSPGGSRRNIPLPKED